MMYYRSKTQEDELARYLKELLRQDKPELVRNLFLSQHPEWQRQNAAIFVEAEQFLKNKASNSFHLY